MTWTNKLLLDEPAIGFQPRLAVALGGADEALVTQQIHYWLRISKNERDGHTWVYNTTKDWKEKLPWLSEDSIRRIMRKLRDAGIIVTANYNHAKFDRTLWYRLDYQVLESVLAESLDRVAESPLHVAKTPNGSGDSTGPIPEDYTKNTSKDVVVVVGDDDPALGEVFQLWQDNMPGSLTPIISDSVKDLCSSYGASEVKFAILEAVKSNARNLRYIQAILVNRAAGRDKPTPANVGPVGGGRWVPAQKQTNVDRSIAAVDAVFARFENGGAL